MKEKKLIVDPGFVHYRKIEAIVGDAGSEIINNEIAKIAASTPGWRKEVLIDKIYSRITIEFCKVNEIATLPQLLLNDRGHLFCSIVKFKPCEKFYESERVIINTINDTGEYSVELHLTTKRVRSDTLRSGLHQGGEFAVVAQFVARKDNTLIFHPLLIGFPYMYDSTSGDLLWELYNDFYELHIEDFEEFSEVKKYPLPDSIDEMRLIKESVFKKCLGKLLKESTPKDWGGESSDFITSHLHINGKRLSAAFLLKGPAKFTPMKIKHLGKNGDQIVRLSKEPVSVLIVQHCHDILSPVRETLKVFSTQPSNPRRYCLVDGRESLRILKAYNLFDWAVQESTRGITNE